MGNIDLLYENERMELLNQKSKIDKQLDAITVVKTLSHQNNDENKNCRRFTITTDLLSSDMYRYMLLNIPEKKRLTSVELTDKINRDQGIYSIYVLLSPYKMLKISLTKKYVSGFREMESSFSYNLRLESNQSDSYLCLESNETPDGGYNIKIKDIMGQEFQKFHTNQDYTELGKNNRILYQGLETVSLDGLIDSILTEYEIVQDNSRNRKPVI